MIYLRRLTDRLVKFWFPVLVLLVLLVSVSYARGVAILKDENITVVLTDEPCRLDVKLPYRLTWAEKGKTFEGCFSVHGPVVVAYFDDRSVALFPGQLFRPLTDS